MRRESGSGALVGGRINKHNIKRILLRHGWSAWAGASSGAATCGTCSYAARTGARNAMITTTTPHVRRCVAIATSQARPQRWVTAHGTAAPGVRALAPTRPHAFARGVGTAAHAFGRRYHRVYSHCGVVRPRQAVRRAVAPWHARVHERACATLLAGSSDDDDDTPIDEVDFPLGLRGRPVGVKYNKGRKTWGASIKVRGTSVYLGECARRANVVPVPAPVCSRHHWLNERAARHV